jgi:hypothetical protein
MATSFKKKTIVNPRVPTSPSDTKKLPIIPPKIPEVYSTAASNPLLSFLKFFVSIAKTAGVLIQ